MPHGSGNGYTLGSSQFEHTLHVLSKKGGFNGKFVGFVLADQSAHRIKYQLKSFVIVFDLTRFEHSQIEQLHFVSLHMDQSIAHYHRSRVDPQYYFRFLLQAAQYFYKVMKLLRKGKILVRYLLGPILLLVLVGAIIQELRSQQNLSQLLDGLRSAFTGATTGEGIFWLTTLIILMPLNWLLEAIKWRTAIGTLQLVSLFTAFKATLSGVSFSVSLPNRVGEYLGRMLYLDEGNRLKAIPVTVVASLSQLLLTLLAGILSVVYLFPVLTRPGLFSVSYLFLFIVAVLVGLLILLLLYFRIGGLAGRLLNLFDVKWLRYWAEGLSYFDKPRLTKMLWLSAARYGIFLLQYAAAFAVFNVSITSLELVTTISLCFLLMSVVPNFAIAELGIRGMLMVWVVGIYSTNKAGILLATLSIWLVNLILPAVVGALLLVGNRKLYTRKDEKN